MITKAKRFLLQFGKRVNGLKLTRIRNISKTDLYNTVRNLPLSNKPHFADPIYRIPCVSHLSLILKKISAVCIGSDPIEEIAMILIGSSGDGCQKTDMEI